MSEARLNEAEPDRHQPEPVYRYELPPASAEEAENRHIEAQVYADDDDEEPF